MTVFWEASRWVGASVLVGGTATFIALVTYGSFWTAREALCARRVDRQVARFAARLDDVRDVSVLEDS